MEHCTVLLIVDQGFGWDEVRRIVTGLPDVQVIGETTNAAEAEQLARTHRPTFIIATDLLDNVVTLPLLVAITQGQSHASKVIVYAHAVRPEFFFAGIQRWLRAYLLRTHLTQQQLSIALELVLCYGMVLGNTVVIESFVAALTSTAMPQAGAPVLTERQLLILRAVAAGVKEREIARHVGKGFSTVRDDIAAMKQVFGVETLTALVMAAMRAGVIR